LTGFIAGFMPGGVIGFSVRSINTSVRREAVYGGVALGATGAAWALALM